VLAWQRMNVATGAMLLGANASGLAVTLVPRRPTAAWTGSIELFGAPHGLQSRTTTTDPPAISRLDTWTSAGMLASGPLIPDRLGMVLEASWTKAMRYERDDPTRLSEKLGSVFTHLVFAPTRRDEIRFIGWAQGTRSPSRTRNPPHPNAEHPCMCSRSGSGAVQQEVAPWIRRGPGSSRSRRGGAERILSPFRRS
jgi:hypothetical protein